jgi:hypothetical protein
MEENLNIITLDQNFFHFMDCLVEITTKRASIFKKMVNNEQHEEDITNMGNFEQFDAIVEQNKQRVDPLLYCKKFNVLKTEFEDVARKFDIQLRGHDLEETAREHLSCYIEESRKNEEMFEALFKKYRVGNRLFNNINYNDIEIYCV